MLSQSEMSERETRQPEQMPNIWPFALCVVLIIVMAAAGMYYRPDERSNVATIGGMILTALFAIRSEQKALRHTVNSQLDAYKKLIYEVAYRAGGEAERKPAAPPPQSDTK